ncbi:response regulator transcription factor [Alkalicoccus halolimnae]|uniref:Response regulator n=1 Tax=Alkalicoccus halolimnae TaxID=1667239 RepID=A0A5C7FBN5_9BACI|nr:response regulator [Alkalicoccus halolimnae]TXF86858.1 response regulator [Alkalicoccus halolimnae]
MKRVLVADDEDILRMLITDTLEDAGYALEEAEDGEQTFQLLQKKTYDLVILDYMMPGKTGLEVLQSLPEDVKKTTIFIMLTAKAQESDKKTALQAGAAYFVAKPFSPGELERLVGEVI